MTDNGRERDSTERQERFNQLWRWTVLWVLAGIGCLLCGLYYR